MARTSETTTLCIPAWFVGLSADSFYAGQTVTIEDHECQKLFRVVRVLDEDHVEIERLYH